MVKLSYSVIDKRKAFSQRMASGVHEQTDVAAL
jgi:hypothetical protein